MAKGQKTGGRDWRPGESGNPNGRPRVPDEIRELRKLKRSEIEEKIADMLTKTDAELFVIESDEMSTAIDKILAKIVRAAIDKGDQWKLGFLLDRLIGTPKKTVALEGGDDDSNPIRMSDMSNEERAKLIKIARGEEES